MQRICGSRENDSPPWSSTNRRRSRVFRIGGYAMRRLLSLYSCRDHQSPRLTTHRRVFGIRNSSRPLLANNHSYTYTPPVEDHWTCTYKTIPAPRWVQFYTVIIIIILRHYGISSTNSARYVHIGDGHKASALGRGQV